MVSQRPHRPLSVLKTRAVRGKLRKEPFSFNVPSAFFSLQNECGNAITPYFSNSLMLGFFFLSFFSISQLPMLFLLWPLNTTPLQVFTVKNKKDSSVLILHNWTNFIAQYFYNSLCYSLNSKRLPENSSPSLSHFSSRPILQQRGSKFFIILGVMNINITKIPYPQLKDTRKFSSDWVIYRKLLS